MKWFRISVAVLALAVVLAVTGGVYLWRRALPQVEGTVRVAGLSGAVEIIRDFWGVPHIYASQERDGMFGLGWAVAQDRLFHLELLRRLGQGRLAEIFGPEVLKIDRLYRTMGFHRAGQRVIAALEPEVRANLEAYAAGVNQYVASLEGRLPIEFVLLGISFPPVQVDDFGGILGFMTWNLNPGWKFDPLYEALAAKVGDERAAELLPVRLPKGRRRRARPAATASSGLRPDLFLLGAGEQALVEMLGGVAASNNWVVGPKKSATGAAILANDMHLAHGIPGIWYQFHLTAGDLNVTGVTIPGLPFVAVGHNRRIAWGFTNVEADAGDFFLEKLNPLNPGEVMNRGEWVKIREEKVSIAVKGQAPEELVIRRTPHGPIVNDLLPGQKQALSYQWVLHEATDANELNGFYHLNRARDWSEFRAAVAKFGGLAQNVAYADSEGHIGIQVVGRMLRLEGRTEGNRYRIGWDGSQEWAGLRPFDENPFVYDPPEGWAASANNTSLAGRAPYYVSAYWEPVDRISRIREWLGAPGRISVQSFQRLQADTVLYSARQYTPMILEAFQEHPPATPGLQAALEFLKGWDGAMDAESQAAAVFAVFYKHLFYELFADEMGAELAGSFRELGNVSAVMIHSVMRNGPTHWFDRVDTPTVEDRGATLRAALAKATGELEQRLGKDPQAWKWGRLHTLEFVHPLGRVKALAPFFNVGAFPMPGHANTINKMEFKDGDFKVFHGPSMRHITDFSDLDGALAILPTGQSGIPASPHYDDLAPLWVAGKYHPLPLSRVAVEKLAESRLVLQP